MSLFWLIAWLVAGTPRVDWFNDGWNGWGITLLVCLACDLLDCKGTSTRC